jgi:adenine-specific DNA-methyltransferase
LNSIRGLVSLRSNVNNLPYQVKWSDNEKFSYKSINSSINLFTELFKTTNIDWKTNFIKEIKKLGQYFTKDDSLKEKVKEFVKNSEGSILEPCIGRGDLVSLFKKREVDMYEIDTSIEFLPDVDQTKIIFGDFLKLNVTKMYKTIVSNPPYVKLKTGNIYKDFIEKCFGLLEENGEMIFIVASDFFKKTNCCKLLSMMMKYGCFTDVYYPKNENLFEHASVDIVIFRYCKSISLEKICNFNNVKKFVNEINGIVTFENSIKNLPMSDFFNVKVGIVSGCEEVFKQEFGNKSLITAENKTEKYILIEQFPSGNKNIDSHLFLNKNTLMKRKIRKFNETNWYQFGALRNINFIQENLGKKCIYIYNVSRKENVAFIGRVDFFSSNLLLLLPKNKVDLEKVNIYLNSTEFKENYTYSGRFMIGQKQIENHLTSNFI